MKKKFKDWAIPGPHLENLPAPPPGETLDAIAGGYRIFQYADGHRFSTDDLLVAWYGTTHGLRAERALDLGSGIGSVATIAAWRLPGARFVTVEAQERSIALARKSMALNGLSDRVDLRLGDFRDPGVLAPDERFDLVLGSPPYFPLSDGVHGDHPQKIECRFEARGDVADYCAAAARHLAPGGMFFLVFPRNQEHRLLDGAREAALGVLRARDAIAKEGEPPLLAVYQLALREDFPAAFWAKLGPRGIEEPPLTIRRRDGTVHPEYSVVKLSIGFPP